MITIIYHNKLIYINFNILLTLLFLYYHHNCDNNNDKDYYNYSHCNQKPWLKPPISYKQIINREFTFIIAIINKIAIVEIVRAWTIAILISALLSCRTISENNIIKTCILSSPSLSRSISTHSRCSINTNRI